MNKSTLERQTGLVASKVNQYHYLGDAIGDAKFSIASWSESKAWQSLFDQWWRKRKIEVFERDNRKCVRCGSDRNIECDHVRNRSQGGDSSMDNLQTLCRECHYKKTNNKD
jgi:ribosomal protein S27AE